MDKIWSTGLRRGRKQEVVEKELEENNMGKMGKGLIC